MPSWERLRLLLLACAGLPGCASPPQPSLSAKLGQQFQYNDNMALSETRRETVVGYQASPGVKARLKQGPWSLTATGQGDVRRYDATQWDCDSYSLGLESAYRERRNVFRLGGGYSLACSYQQQLSDTGLLVPTVRLENFSATPSWVWRWNGRTRLLAEAGYTKTDYLDLPPDAGAFSFQASQTYLARLGGQHDWSRRLGLNAGLDFSDTEYASGNTQRVYGFQAGGSYRLDRRWKLTASAGPRWIETQPLGSLILSGIGGLGLEYADRFNQFSAGYARTISPSALGEAQGYDTATAGYQRKLGRGLALSLGASFQHGQAIGGGAGLTGNFSRDFLNLTLGLLWKFARDWEAKAEYGYRWQRYHQPGSPEADANSVMFSLTYGWEWRSR